MNLRDRLSDAPITVAACVTAILFGSVRNAWFRPHHALPVGENRSSHHNATADHRSAIVRVETQLKRSDKGCVPHAMVAARARARSIGPATSRAGRVRHNLPNAG